MKKQINDKQYPYYFLIPAIIVFTVFFVVPAFLGLYLSLTDAKVGTLQNNFIGLDNYKNLFLKNGKVFATSIFNQFKFAFFVTIAKTGIGVTFALFLDRKFLGRNFLRALVYMPIMFSPIVVGIIFNFLLSYDGFFNNLLRAIGLDFITRDWLGDFGTALYSVAGVDTWIGVGWTVVIVLAALQAIPKDVLECASVDGATPIIKIFKIKIPYIMHAIGIAILLTTISGMKAFDIIYATTGGGPGHATEVITTFVAKAMSSGSLGYPAAASFIQFVLITIIAFIIHTVTRRMEAKE